MRARLDALVNRLCRTGLAVAFQLLRVYWFVFRPRTRGVYVALWCDGRVLLVRNSYRPFPSLPGGRIKRGEPPAEAGARELREEVGVSVGAGSMRFVSEYTCLEHHHEDRASFFECELPHEPALRIDEREVIWAGFRSAQQALAGDLAGPVRAYLEEHGR